MDHKELYKWLDFFWNGTGLHGMTTKFEELLRHLLSELHTTKIGPGPIIAR